MIQAQLDNQLIDYYKLLVTTYVKAGDVAQANSALDKMRRLILMDFSVVVSKEDEVAQILDEMDNWIVRVDPSTIPVAQNRLIPLPKKVEEPPKRKFRRRK